MPYVYVDYNIHLYTYDINEYISKSTIIKYRDNGLTEKSIQMYFNKRRINLQKIVRMPGHVYASEKTYFVEGRFNVKRAKGRLQ